MALYEALIAAGVPDAVDVEIFRDEAVVDRIIAAAHAADVKVIASNHEFGHTPAAEELVRPLLLMERRGADVRKRAVMPKSPGAVLALLGATWTTSQQATRPLITMSMTATASSRASPAAPSARARPLAPSARRARPARFRWRSCARRSPSSTPSSDSKLT